MKGPDGWRRARDPGAGRGKPIFSPVVAARILAFLASGAPAAPADAFPQLTERMGTILPLLGQGASNAAVATRLGLQIRTVSHCLSNIFRKLQVADRAEAMARQAGEE